MIKLESFSTKSFQLSASALLKGLVLLEVHIHYVFIRANKSVSVCVESGLCGHRLYAYLLVYIFTSAIFSRALYLFHL